MMFSLCNYIETEHGALAFKVGHIRFCSANIADNPDWENGNTFLIAIIEIQKGNEK